MRNEDNRRRRGKKNEIVKSRRRKLIGVESDRSRKHDGAGKNGT